MRLTGSHPRLLAVVLAMAGLLVLAAPAADAAGPPGANDFGCRPSAAHPAPVVLVHGTFESAADNWGLVAPQIKAAGYCVFALDYGQRGTGDIAASAEELARFVETVLAATRAGKVSLVGHSQGGMMPAGT